MNTERHAISVENARRSIERHAFMHFQLKMHVVLWNDMHLQQKRYAFPVPAGSARRSQRRAKAAENAEPAEKTCKTS